MSRTRPTLWLFGTLVATAPSVSTAETLPDVTVDKCRAVDATHVREMVALEMRVLGGHQNVPWPPVRVACTGELARIQVGSEAPQRTLDLTGFPVQARARILAVEISVLLAPLLEQTTLAAPATPPATTPILAPKTAPPRLALGAVMARLGRPQVSGFGLDLGFSWPLHNSRYLLHGDLRALTASWAVSPGTVRARDVSVAVAALVGNAWGGVWLGAGPALRGGHVWLQWLASPAGMGFDRNWWGPAGSAVVFWTTNVRWSVSANLEVGYVVRPVEGELDPQSTAAISLAGRWASAALTVELAL